MLAQSMRPKWKIDTYYIPLSDGIYLRGNNNRLILKGKSLYSLLERLVPNLDGNVSLEEITAGMDVNRKQMLTKLLEKLLAHDFLSDASQDQQHTLCPSESETYALNIAFVESFQVSAASRFEDFRNKRLLLIGSGPCFTALVQACLQSGVKKISAIIMSENATEASSRQELLHLFANNTFEQTMDFIDAPSWNDEAEVNNTIQAYDAILHISEKPLLARSQLLNRLCFEQRKVFIQAILVADRVWIGPLVCPETGGCWECAWRRLQATLTDFSAQSLHYEFQDHCLSTGGESLAGPGATIVANQLIFTLFQYFTRTNSSEVVGKLSAFDPTTLLSENHTFLPHPHCLACQRSIVPTAVQFLEQIQWLQHQKPEDPDMLLDKVAGCIDEKLGLFAAPNNRNFVQVPLAVYKVPISHPAGRYSPEGSGIVAVGIDTRDTQRQAVQKACMYYAASLVDQRRLLSTEMIQHLQTFPALSSDQLIETDALPPEDGMWTWALDLQTWQASLVPATRVFLPPDYRVRGLGVGMSWEEAVCQALLDWCNHITIEKLQSTQQVYLPVDLDKMSMTPEGAYLYRLLKATGESFIIYDVTGSLRVPTLAICWNGQVISYTTHCNIAQALSLGFTQALQQYQATQFQQPDYALAPVPDLPLFLRGEQFSVPHFPSPDGWPARREWLLEQLQTNGLRAFALPLDHDPALAQVFPFIARVLLAKENRTKEK